jgi:hypothetical protein
MSPLFIKMLMHYRGCARDYRDEVPGQHAASEAVKEVIQSFLAWELLIEIVPHEEWSRLDAMERRSPFTITERGQAMVDAYMAVKLPVIQWVQP